MSFFKLGNDLILAELEYKFLFKQVMAYSQLSCNVNFCLVKLWPAPNRARMSIFADFYLVKLRFDG